MKTRIHEERPERRANLRFPLQLSISYRTLSAPFRSGALHGATLNISSSGLLFEANEDLRPGQHVAVRVDWPMLLDDHVPLSLVLDGRILRCDNGVAAMQIFRHEFRTCKSAGAQNSTVEQVEKAQTHIAFGNSA